MPTLKKGKRGRGLCLRDLAFLYTERAAPKGDSKEGGKRSDAAEHVTVCAHRVVPHEQLASEGFVVEVVGELVHRFFEVVALFDDVPGEVFLAVPLAAVGLLCHVNVLLEHGRGIDGEGFRASKPGSVSTELKLRSEKRKVHNLLIFQRSYEPTLNEITLQ